jgi:hypothetical protein
MPCHFKPCTAADTKLEKLGGNKSFDTQRKNSSSGPEYGHSTEKSEAIAPCKEMPVIPVNKLVDKKRIIGKGGLEEERHLGSQMYSSLPSSG